MRHGLLRHRLAPATDAATAPELAERILLALATAHPDADLVWLDSGVGARTGRSLLSADGARVSLDAAAPVLPQLRAALGAMPAPGVDSSLSGSGADPAPPLGLVGWFGYELRDETMGMPAPATPPADRASWLAVDRGLVLDHVTGSLELVALDAAGTGWSGELAGWRARMLELVEGARRASAPPPVDPAPRTARWRDDDARYAELVRRCQEAIREGQAYQLCLTSAATVDAPGDAIELYRRVRRASPAHHGALLRIGGATLVSASPETFLRVEREPGPDGGLRARTRPIKGTRPRGADLDSDAALVAELEASDKERAENLMIVDLMRNDLSRVSELGSVVVTGLLEVESYAQVHQLVSTVEGRLRDGLDAIDAIAACFPAGSMTGAPKRRAIELLAAWEGAPRGVYSGAFGYLAVDGSADLAMVIRSILVADGVATIGAGGGITALSEPEAEVAEMRLKARSLLTALGVRDEADARPEVTADPQ